MVALFGGGKKKTCTFCGGKAGLFSSRKMADGELVCDSCREDASAWLEAEAVDRARMAANMEQMKRNDAFLLAALGNYTEQSHMDEKFHFATHHGRVLFFDEIGMFGLEDTDRDPSRVELFRYDQIAEYTSRTANPLMYKSEDFPMKRAAVEFKLRGHPFLESVEVQYVDRVGEEAKDFVVYAVNDTIKHFDEILGPPAKRLPDPVTVMFGNTFADVGRKVGPEQAERIAALTQLADAAEERWGKIF
jgi:hypothetical protein